MVSPPSAKVLYQAFASLAFACLAFACLALKGTDTSGSVHANVHETMHSSVRCG